MEYFKKIITDELVKITNMKFEDIFSSIEIPKKKEYGDFAFPCFKLSKELKKSPQIIANDLVIKLNEQKNEYVEEYNLLGAYINIKLKTNKIVEHLVNKIIDKKNDYGKLNIGNNKTILLDFSSTNIAKPFHIGHLRSTVIGNSLYRIYKNLGYNAVAINYLGDYGTQFGKLIVAYKLWGNKEEIEKDPIREFLKIYVKFHEEAEKNKKLEDEAREIFKKLENKEDEEIYNLWVWIKETSLKEFKKVYEMLDVHFDSYNGESYYQDKLNVALDVLREKGIVKKDDGAEIVDLSEYNMPPALITKKDGSTLYMTRDIAAAIVRKQEYNYDKNIYVVAYQQDLHFKQWFKVLELMGYDYAKDCVHVNFGMVSLPDGTLKTREGKVVFLEEVLLNSIDLVKKIIEEKNPNLENKDEIAKQIGVGAVIFQDLFNLRIKDYVFDWNKFLSFEGETGPYVQYAHARACSILTKNNIIEENINLSINFDLLNDDISRELIIELLNFEKVIIEASEDYEPSKITRYVVNIAQLFNKFYNENQINVDDIELKTARIALVYISKLVIKNALYLIGIKAPEKM